MASSDSPARWLILIHQIPPKPHYFRIKVGRRLARLGAVAIKNSIYALPWSDGGYEDFQWLAREIQRDGGEATVIEARLLEGLDDPAVEALFNDARDADYAELVEEAKQLDAPSAANVERLRRRFTEIESIDFFGARGRVIAGGLIGALEAKVAPPPASSDATSAREAYVGRTWVTRKGIHVDRMASAWLIRRYIDPDARFKFVVAKGYAPEPGELRFDMVDAEFTHEGDLCTFEVLCARFGLDDPGLRALAEIVHDIDLKDGKFGRPDTPGIAQLVAAIATAHKEDEGRLARACDVLDDLVELYRRTK